MKITRKNIPVIENLILKFGLNPAKFDLSGKKVKLPSYISRYAVFTLFESAKSAKYYIAHVPDTDYLEYRLEKVGENFFAKQINTAFGDRVERITPLSKEDLSVIKDINNPKKEELTELMLNLIKDRRFGL